MATTTTADLQQLYRDVILDHARQPRHFGRPSSHTHEAAGINPLCGDKLHIYLLLGDERVSDAAFEGSGCAISMASASLMTESVIGRSVSEALEVSERVEQMLRGEDVTEQLGDLQALAGVREFPSRVKCAGLAWRALQAALNESGQNVTTE